MQYLAINDGFMGGNPSGTDYSYDKSGNMTQDLNKDINIDYNYLNIPKRVYPERTGNDEIRFTYDASGTKWQKLHKVSNDSTKISYCNNFIYNGELLSMELDKILHPEGGIEVSSSSHAYHYFIKDHLGS